MAKISALTPWVPMVLSVTETLEVVMRYCDGCMTGVGVGGVSHRVQMEVTCGCDHTKHCYIGFEMFQSV